MIEVQMAKKQFDFLKEKDKLFIIDFTKKLEELGYNTAAKSTAASVGEGICLSSGRRTSNPKMWQPVFI